MWSKNSICDDTRKKSRASALRAWNNGDVPVDTSQQGSTEAAIERFRVQFEAAQIVTSRWSLRRLDRV